MVFCDITYSMYSIIIVNNKQINIFVNYTGLHFYNTQISILFDINCFEYGKLGMHSNCEQNFLYELMVRTKEYACS